MKAKRLLPLMLLFAAPLGATKPIAVSPGTTSRATLVEARCPTFSWGLVSEARGYEITAFAADPEGSPLHRAPALRQRLPGNVTSWTPSLGSCLEPGQRYVWVLKVVPGEAGRAAADPDLSSEPRFFEIAEPRTSRQTVRAWLRELSAERDGGAPATEGTASETTGAAEPSPSTRLREAPPTRAGTGPDFSVDGSGNVSASSFSGDGAGLTNVTASTLGFEITGAEVADASLTGDDLANFTVNAFKIGTEQVTNIHIKDGQVFSSEIADGTVTSADIADGAVTSADIANSTISAEDIADESLTGSDIQNNSVSAVNLSNEAGVEFAGGDAFLSVGTVAVVESLSITAPTFGYVVVTATAVANLSPIGSSAIACSITQGSTVDSNAEVDLTTSHPLALTRGFTVNAGANDFNLVCAAAFSGGATPPALKDTHMTAVFAPTRY